ncbi:hypothetical protein [uncultured Mucilaginibacter sp.]|uniref:hypothetical protein n=1 Tax=uncultured Mucilaginibacter sp. TaxID=797541 RepID=UPI0025EAEA3C|nr:hypothetical protein [uncultured Mucilaginibacter sp.]
MIVEDPAALRFFLIDDIYLLKQDKDTMGNTIPETGPMPVVQTEVLETVIADEQPEPVEASPHPTPIAAESPIVETPKPAFQYFGKNQRNFLIVFHSNGMGKLDDKHFAALSSSLARKELSLDDVALLDLYAYEDTTIADIAAYFKPTRVMILGSQCLLPGWHKLKLNVPAKGNTYTALYTYSFDEMMPDKDKVRAFWEQMKAL